MRRFLKKIVSPRQLRAELRRDGWKAVLRSRGTPLIVAIVLYYVVRDSLLYIVIPLLVARGFF